MDVNQLLHLPPHLLAVPAQVFEIFICGLQPCDQDVDWPEEVFVTVCDYTYVPSAFFVYLKLQYVYLMSCVFLHT